VEKYQISLEVINERFIAAPDFCPHASLPADALLNSIKRIIAPQICSVCKACEFLSSVNESVLPVAPASVGLSDAQRAKFIKYLTEVNGKLAQSVSSQLLYLRQKQRLPLAIFISSWVFQQAAAYLQLSADEISLLLSYYGAVPQTIGVISGCPVILLAKLGKTNIQVVGEIEWK